MSTFKMSADDPSVCGYSLTRVRGSARPAALGGEARAELTIAKIISVVVLGISPGGAA